MRRTFFYKKFTTDGIEELDFLYNSLSEFEITIETKRYRVDGSDIPDPALISYKCYGSVYFWWILLVANGIQNPFSELTPGTLLVVPNVVDIYNFQKKHRVRRE